MLCCIIVLILGITLYIYVLFRIGYFYVILIIIIIIFVYRLFSSRSCTVYECFPLIFVVSIFLPDIQNSHALLHTSSRLRWSPPRYQPFHLHLACSHVIFYCWIVFCCIMLILRLVILRVSTSLMSHTSGLLSSDSFIFSCFSSYFSSLSFFLFLSLFSYADLSPLLYFSHMFFSYCFAFLLFVLGVSALLYCSVHTTMCEP